MVSARLDPLRDDAGCDTSPFADVFCIPHENGYIIYLPLRGLILFGNASLVNALCRARSGDESALAELGIDEALVSELFESGRHLAILSAPKDTPAFAPTSVTLFLTNDCTLRCRYCYADGGHNSNEMPFDMASAVVDEVVGNALNKGAEGISVSFHGGGDVSAAWDLLVRVRNYMRRQTTRHSLKCHTSVGLNGILNDRQRQWIIRNIDGATVSVDGPPDIHDSQRPLAGGGGSYRIVHDTLKAFDRAGFPYAIRTTVTSLGVGRLEETAEHLCGQFGVRRIKAEPMYPRGRAARSDFSPPGEADFVEHFRRAKAVADAAGREFIYSGARMETLTSVFCRAAGDSCAITPDGWVTSCYEVLSPDDPLASRFFYGRYDPKSRRITVDEERRRALFACSVHSRPECAKCFCKWHCAGDCPAKALHYREARSPDLLDRCYINRELTKDQLIAAIG